MIFKKLRSMKTCHFSLLTAPALLLASLGTASAATLVQDSFTDGDRVNGTDAQDIAWSAGTVLATGTLPGTGNYLQVPAGTSGFGQVSGYLPSSSLLNLAVGQTLNLSFNFSYASDPGSDVDGFRFGLLGASGTQVGTGVILGVGGSNTGVDLRYDSISGGSSFGGSTAGDNVAYPSQSKTSMTAGLTENTVYAMNMSLTRNLNSLSIEVTANGGSASATVADTSGGFYTDYSAGSFIARSGGPLADMNIDDVVITVVPEPTTAALACLSLFALARRRR